MTMQGNGTFTAQFITDISSRVLTMTDTQRAELLGHLTRMFGEGNVHAMFAIAIVAQLWYADLTTRIEAPQA